MSQQTDNRVAKVCGADVELGNFVLGANSSRGTGQIASEALLREMPGIPQYASVYTCGHAQDWGRKFMVSNGGCAYIDLDHLELCIPEVLSAYDYVAAWHAMLLLARQAMDAANATARDGLRLRVLVNNSDGLGNSYGAHLNFLILRRTWEDIFHRKPHYMAYLASHQVSSIVVTGQGKVGAENGAPPVDYQLSQRADFDMTMSGTQTTFDRPLVNARDEALCGAAAWNKSGRRETDLARLHCIFYDSNLCHVANLLKVGMMQIVLAMLEAGCANPLLIIENPLEALISFSHDPTLHARARMASGRRLTAVELQSLFLQEAQEFCERGGCDGVVAQASDILALYADTLQKLHAGEIDALAGRLDWVLKLQLIRRAMAQRPELAWNTPEVKHLDHLYSDLSPEGLYWICERAGLVERVASAAQIERMVHQPPRDTRAYARTMLLRFAAREQVRRIDWDSMGFRLPGRSGWSRYRTLDLADPRSMTEADTRHLFQAGLALDELLDRLTDLDRKTHDQEDGSTAATGGSAGQSTPLLLAAPQRTTSNGNPKVSGVESVRNQLPQQDGGQHDAIA